MRRIGMLPRNRFLYKKPDENVRRAFHHHAGGR
jgi:hypothetical protein